MLLVIVTCYCVMMYSSKKRSSVYKRRYYDDDYIPQHSSTYFENPFIAKPDLISGRKSPYREYSRDDIKVPYYKSDFLKDYKSDFAKGYKTDFLKDYKSDILKDYKSDFLKDYKSDFLKNYKNEADSEDSDLEYDNVVYEEEKNVNESFDLNELDYNNYSSSKGDNYNTSYNSGYNKGYKKYSEDIPQHSSTYFENPFYNVTGRSDLSGGRESPYREYSRDDIRIPYSYRSNDDNSVNYDSMNYSRGKCICHLLMNQTQLSQSSTDNIEFIPLRIPYSKDDFLVDYSTPGLKTYYSRTNLDEIPQHSNTYFMNTMDNDKNDKFTRYREPRRVRYDSQLSVSSGSLGSGSGRGSPAWRPATPLSKFCPVHHIPTNRAMVLHKEEAKPFSRLIRDDFVS